MSSTVDTGAVNKETICIDPFTYPQVQKSNDHKHVLKSKENIFKLKCRKALKRKLKKYKLRRDGKEDQDIIDISRTLLFSLKIKSPKKLVNHTHHFTNNIIDSENITPKNYLFRMVRKKEKKNLLVNNCEITQNMEVKTNCISSKNITHEEISSSQERKQTNAFKLMMDSRNKRIGANSPGKEKSNCEHETQNIIEKKKIKAKRNLMLQKMAEAKGSLKKQELEEYKEEFIKKKMEERAKRLKNMIFKEPPKESKITKKLDTSFFEHNKHMPSQSAPSVIKELNEDIRLLANKTINNKLSREDDEFLKKLSPSLKKENMLSYFKKVEQESETSVTESSDDNNQVMNIKLTPTMKKKTKKKKLSLKRVESLVTKNCDKKNNNLVTQNITSKNVHDFLNERDRNDFEGVIDIVDGKPKRNIKRPIRYNDDMHLTSSDEEYYIITPKKKKHIDSNTNSGKKINNRSKTRHIKSCMETVQFSLNKEKKVIKEVNQLREPTKLAPIFVRQLKSETKQKFFHSELPDHLKKNIIQQSIKNAVPVNFFPVVHVQQSLKTNEVSSLSYLHATDFDESISTEDKDISYKKIISLNEIENNKFMIPKINIKGILCSMKKMHLKFPIYRIYHLMTDKCKGEFNCNYSNLNNSVDIISDIIDVKNLNPDTLNWTDKYRALASNQIIGNFQSIKDLKRWLLSWTESEARSKKDLNVESDSSDFCYSDMDSTDSVKVTNNLLIIAGPVGSGKTSSVYAVAAELAMKVIEVNSSAKRNGKIMLQDLHEATQSHNINRGKGSSSTENSQKSTEVIEIDIQKNVKKRGRPKKRNQNLKDDIKNTSSNSLSLDSVRPGMSLILIDDADIMFEQDDGFCSAIAQLVQCSKRPLILITSSLSCPHLQKFLQFGKIIKMKPLFPNILGTWLDIMCLADSGVCWPGIGAKFLDFFNGDIRKTINCLHFYMSTNTYNALREEEGCDLNSDDYKPFLDDESSSMSWMNNNMSESKNNTPEATIDFENTVWSEFIIQQLPFSNFEYPFKLFNIWWSLPKMLYHNTKNEFNFAKEKIDNIKSRQNTITELTKIANVVECVSISDYLSDERHSSANITSQPWFSCETDNVTENENLYEYNKCNETGNEILHYLVTRSITGTQRSLENNTNLKLSSPDMALQREKDRIISRHKDLTSYLNLAAVSDRRALALDYWPACRYICRTERVKTDSKSKRHNRFCHYLKSVKIMSKNELFDNLCDSLYPDNNDISM